jgi:hypothetical protein
MGLPTRFPKLRVAGSNPVVRLEKAPEIWAFCMTADEREVGRYLRPTALASTDERGAPVLRLMSGSPLSGRFLPKVIGSRLTSSRRPSRSTGPRGHVLRASSTTGRTHAERCGTWDSMEGSGRLASG